MLQAGQNFNPFQQGYFLELDTLSGIIELLLLIAILIIFWKIIKSSKFIR